jgi:hypothetical protein
MKELYCGQPWFKSLACLWTQWLPTLPYQVIAQSEPKFSSLAIFFVNATGCRGPEIAGHSQRIYQNLVYPTDDSFQTLFFPSLSFLACAYLTLDYCNVKCFPFISHLIKTYVPYLSIFNLYNYWPVTYPEDTQHGCGRRRRLAASNA